MIRKFSNLIKILDQYMQKYRNFKQRKSYIKAQQKLFKTKYKQKIFKSQKKRRYHILKEWKISGKKTNKWTTE